MKKCRKEDDNILFIDASKEFEKVKTQNKLRKEHIDKIVDTYRNRTEIEKYSHLATLQEVADNDYNLNIPVMWIPLKRKSLSTLRLSWLKSRNWKPNVLTLTKRLKATFVNWEL